MLGQVDQDLGVWVSEWYILLCGLGSCFVVWVWVWMGSIFRCVGWVGKVFIFIVWKNILDVWIDQGRCAGFGCGHVCVRGMDVKLGGLDQMDG